MSKVSVASARAGQNSALCRGVLEQRSPSTKRAYVVFLGTPGRLFCLKVGGELGRKLSGGTPQI